MFSALDGRVGPERSGTSALLGLGLGLGVDLDGRVGVGEERDERVTLRAEHLVRLQD